MLREDQRRAVSGQSTALHLSYVLGLRGHFLKTETRLQRKGLKTLRLEEVLARQTTMCIRSERRGEEERGEWIMKPVGSRVKSRKGCGISQGSGSGLYPLERMPIVEWVRLLKGTAWAPSPSTTQLLKPSTPKCRLLAPVSPSCSPDPWPPLPTSLPQSSQREPSESRPSLL